MSRSGPGRGRPFRRAPPLPTSRPSALPRQAKTTAIVELDEFGDSLSWRRCGLPTFAGGRLGSTVRVLSRRALGHFPRCQGVCGSTEYADALSANPAEARSSGSHLFVADLGASLILGLALCTSPSD